MNVLCLSKKVFIHVLDQKYEYVLGICEEALGMNRLQGNSDRVQSIITL